MDSFTIILFCLLYIIHNDHQLLTHKKFFFKDTHEEKSNPAKEERMWQVTRLLFGDWLEAVCEEVDYT